MTKENFISAMCDLPTSIIDIPDPGPRGVSGLVPNNLRCSTAEAALDCLCLGVHAGGAMEDGDKG